MAACRRGSKNMSKPTVGFTPNNADLERLSEIAGFINATDLADEIHVVKRRIEQQNTELIFPLVGEFSAGKTTLINALTDCKQLETATEPTTATIYEIHFGCDNCHAIIIEANGSKTQVDDISTLKNKELSEVPLVQIYDSSTQIPPTTVLVDTPGLSSPNPMHKQILINFLPKADGILLVIDVNQQITRSLTDFIDMMKLSKRPIYLVITKCDTKAPSELETIKNYISENCKLPIQQMACVSASANELTELYALIESIQKDKDSILSKVTGWRVKNLIAELINRIDELLQSSVSDKDLDNAIREQEIELHRLNRSIDKLVSSSKMDIEDKGRSISRRFEDVITEKLEALVVSKNDNFDMAAVSLINNTSSLLLNDYKTEIKNILHSKAEQSRNTEDDVTLRSFADIDMSGLTVSGISYDINLNEVGHQYDGAIATGTKVLAAVGAVVAIASTGGAAAAVGTADMALDVADTVTDIQSMASNQKSVSRIEKAVSLVGKTSDNLSSINNYDSQIGQNIGGNKGIVESMVGFVTDKTWGKPQRRRAIHLYLDETLLPEFRREMERIGSEILSMIQTALHNEASESFTRKNEALNQLKQERSEKQEAFKKRIAQLNDYKFELIKIK